MERAATRQMGASPLKRSVTDDEIKRYRRDGVVCLRDILTAEWVDTIRAGIEEQREQPGPYATIFKTERSFAIAEQLSSNFNEKLRNAVLHSGAGLIAQQMLEAPQARLLHDNIFYKDSGDIIETPWHQDTANGCFDGMNMIRVWIPVDPVERQTAIEVVRASHLWNAFYVSGDLDVYKDKAVNAEANAYYFDHKPEPYAATPDIEAHRDSFDIVGYEMSPGDVVVFNFHLLHHAGAGQDSRTKRRVLSVIYGDDSLTLRRRPNMVPTQLDVAGRTFNDGQSVMEFADLFPAI
jgi:ectoine hydroxylase-related dioxygenase (phytanoyl-CoA dioxygenase family)